MAEVVVPLASLIMSRITCISATLYGAVETLEVKESTNEVVSLSNNLKHELITNTVT